LGCAVSSAKEISDAALEIAAAMVRGRPASLAIAFCSGLDECPRHQPWLRANVLDVFILKYGFSARARIFGRSAEI
jgi:hypothetical protein